MLNTNLSKSFTLVEIMVAVAISSLMVAAVFEVLIVGNKSWQLGSGLVSIQDNARKAVYYLSRDFRETNTSITNTTLNTSGDSINLNTPSGSVAYSLDTSGDTMRLKRDSSVVGNNIESVGLTQTGRIITITVVSETTGPQQGEKSFTLTREVRRRNE